jgi:hypothetical protein
VEVASSAGIKGDPKIVNFNVAVKDGTEAAARVVYNISACDGNVIVINKFLMPCKVGAGVVWVGLGGGGGCTAERPA